jgi:hypothetical protein
MLEDALLDLTNRCDIVIDPFLASPQTRPAARAAASSWSGPMSM